MYGEVVDGFVRRDGVLGSGFKGCSGEHGEDGIAVRYGERFTLIQASARAR